MITPYLKTPEFLTDYLPQNVDWTQYIINAAEVAINYCSADLTIVFANQTYAAIHGLTPEQITGKRIIDIIGPDAYEAAEPYYLRALSGERVIYEMELRMPIGVRYVQCIYNPVLGNKHRILGWVGVIIDMTERRKLEKALQEKEEKLRAEKEKAEAANVAKTEFLANMSHELRTPLNAIIGLIDILLLKQYPPEKQREYLSVMQTSSAHLMQLINDLLDLTKLGASQGQFDEMPLDLIKINEEVVNINSVQARQKGISLDFRKIPKRDPVFIGDSLRLRQVLMNLVGNAVKFTERGSVNITLDYRNSVIPGVMDIEISVTDTGIGIPQDKLKSIFNKFTQADGSIRRSYGGTGLGLCISKMIIEAMGGTISVRSIYGKGSCFTINLSLPISQKDAFRSEETHQTRAQAKNAPPDSHILLVEDNNGNILVATSLLDIYGYSYSVARDGEDALARLEQHSFDLILMDIQMPGMDGFEVTRLLREREKATSLRPTPIIGMTAHSLIGDRERCIDAGMDDYISKPLNQERFIRLLEDFISKNRASGQVK